MSQRKITLAEVKDALQKIVCADAAGFYMRWLKDNKNSLRQTNASGWSDRVLCPIHDDRVTPSFFVNFHTGGFKCQACAKGGSFIDFYMYMNHMEPKNGQDFAKAIKELSDLLGFDLKAFQESGGNEDVARKIAEEKRQRAQQLSSGNSDNDYEPRKNIADENDKVNEPLPMAMVKKFQEALDADHVEYLNKQRGLTRRTIEKYMIGFDVTSPVKDRDNGMWYNGRYAIPVFDKMGNPRNFRMYSTRAASQYKMINFVIDNKLPTEKGYGKPGRLFNIDDLHNNPKISHVVICGGEWDCMLLNQQLEAGGYDGWLAVTGTHGENTFMHEWIVPMYGKHVYFCLDADEAGKLAAMQHVNDYFLKALVAGKFPEVKIIDLPLPGTKESKDITDFFVKSNFPLERFIELCLQTPAIHAGGFDREEACVDTKEVASFTDAIKDRRYIDQRITVPITIYGSVDRTFHAIRKFKIGYCKFAQMDGGKESAECCMGDSDSKQERTIPYGHPLLIESCNEKEFNILRSIGRMVCQRSGESVPTVTPLQKVVIEKYFAHQVVKRWRAEEDESGRLQNTQELTQAPIYVLQPPNRFNVEPQNYQATGWVRTDPKTMSATFFVEKLVGLDDDWKKFKVEEKENKEIIEYLKNKFTTNQIINEIVQGVTRIYESDEILFAVLLTFLSPIRFAFNGSLLRGWVNTAIIGDSGTGKSQTYIRFSDWIELGDLFSALSGSRTGLLYAVKQRAGEWIVSTGRYVQANDKIIAVDEAQEIQKAEIKQMANAMDLGYLKVERVASGGYQTRTRTIFLMNPKTFSGEAAAMSDFPNGCEGLAMNMDPMFIRRLDLAVFVASGQKHEFYNQRSKVSTGNFEMKLTAKMMRSLIYWAWTRKSNEIIWSDDAVDKCLAMATVMSQEFGDSDKIPLVNPQDFRENLARLSTSYAILDRNFVNDFTAVEVLPTHVERVATLMNMIYSSPACNLRQHSRNAKSRKTIDDYDNILEMIHRVIEQEKMADSSYIRECRPFVQLLSLIHQLTGVKQQDLADQLQVSRQWVQRRLATLQSLNLLEATRWGYKGTRRFNMFMQKWRADPEVEKMFDQAQAAIGRFALAAPKYEDDNSGTQPKTQAQPRIEDPFQ